MKNIERQELGKMIRFRLSEIKWAVHGEVGYLILMFQRVSVKYQPYNVSEKKSNCEDVEREKFGLLE